MRWLPVRLGDNVLKTPDSSSRLLLVKSAAQSAGLHEVARLFKQGFYNYKYVLLLPDGTLDEGFISGNFDATENEYSVIIYYRPVGGRFDRIIGTGSANSINITN